jgi:hypothetical protein
MQSKRADPVSTDMVVVGDIVTIFANMCVRESHHFIIERGSHHMPIHERKGHRSERTQSRVVRGFWWIHELQHPKSTFELLLSDIFIYQ